MTKELRPVRIGEQVSFAELEKAIRNIWKIAGELGLDPFPTHFEIVPARIMYEFGAYGLPGRFSHWSHGKAYHQLKTMYDYGLSKIYELVINTNPAQAFLFEANTPLQNKLVAAHVLGHTDFFKNNVSFRDTNRQMAETAHLHSTRIREYEFKHGEKEVEEFLDAVLSIQTNIDFVDLKRPSGAEYAKTGRERFEARHRSRRQRIFPYDDLFSREELKRPQEQEPKVPFPPEEDQDILWFVGEYSPKPLEPWQKDIISLVRNEIQYFLPQMQTKIMNEGWATFWHLRILRELGERGLLTQAEIVDWMTLHADVATPHPYRINPYWLGWKIWEDINRRFQGLPHPKGKMEKDWFGEKVLPETSKGHEEYDIFWVRANIPSDQAFLRNYLTDTLTEDLELYIYGADGQNLVVQEKSPGAIRQMLVDSLTNLGSPTVKVAIGGGDYRGNNELYLKHLWEGENLDIGWAEKTLKTIYNLWGRPVHLETVIDGDQILLSYTGKETGHSRKKLTA